LEYDGMWEYHKPVMLEETIASLACRRGGIYVDGTVGGGGHAYEILKRIYPEGLLIGIDRDDDAIRASTEKLQAFGDRKILVKGNFADIATILGKLTIDKVDGVLLDLGVSSHQLDVPDRGFGFAQSGRLDMRMDRSRGLDAHALVNTQSERELARIIREYGEEAMAGRIARAIVRRRSSASIETTMELASLIAAAVPGRAGKRKIHPATRTFQALRIAVNDELSNLQKAVPSAILTLREGGRVSVISFHSLEDRIVKHIFRHEASECICPPALPVCVCNKKPAVRLITKKAIKPGKEESEINPRSRSARLRTAERI
jgi:16S rRNA (cytosine1402-N4)-methyltransferase